MILYLSLILGAFGATTWALRSAGERSSPMPLRGLAAVGAVLVLGSFVMMPWVIFTPLSYMLDGMLPDLLQAYAPDVLGRLLRWMGKGSVGWGVTLISSIGYIPGWLLVLLIPSRAIAVRLVIALVGLIGLMSLGGSLTSLVVRHAALQRALGWVQGGTGIVGALLLLGQMPAIDAWGSTGTFAPGLLALASGAQMGPGVWVAWVGLLLVGAGSLLGLSIPETPPDAWASDA